jgi:hypothetical protein
MYDRFTELERLGLEAAFRRTAYKIIQRCRKHSGGLVGRDVHVDGTEAETQARLVHVCGPSCPKRKEESKRGPAHLPDRLSTESVRAIRHEQSKDAPPPEEEQTQLDLGDARKIYKKVDTKTGREYLLIQTAWGRWYRSYDTTAGARAYTRTKGAFRYWHGFYNIKSVDHYTGAPLDVFVMNASITEHHANDLVVDRLKEAIGDTPRSLCYDRDFNVAARLSATRARASRPCRRGAEAATAAAPTTTRSATTATASPAASIAAAKAVSSAST